MKIGHRIDIALAGDDLPENIVIGTVQLLCVLPDKVAHDLIANSYTSFRHGPDPDDYDSKAEGDAALDAWVKPDADSQFIGYLVGKFPTIFAKATPNHVHVIES